MSQLCFNTQTDRVCLSTTPLGDEVLQTELSLQDVRNAANRAGTFIRQNAPYIAGGLLAAGAAGAAGLAGGVALGSYQNQQQYQSDLQRARFLTGDISTAFDPFSDAFVTSTAPELAQQQVQTVQIRNRCPRKY